MLRAKPRTPRGRVADAGAWSIAQDLRARRGWVLDNATCCCTWSARFGATAFEISAFVSLFFDTACIIQLTLPRTMLLATAFDVVDQLRGSLGERYRNNPMGDGVVARVRIDKALAEIARIERVLGRRAPMQFGRSPRSPAARNWHVVEAFRATSWRIRSLSFGRKIGDERGQLLASIGVGVDSGRPSVYANLAAWVPRTNRAWTEFCSRTERELSASGFRIHERQKSTLYADRRIVGVSSTRALKLADEFDALLDTNADIVGR